MNTNCKDNDGKNRECDTVKSTSLMTVSNDTVKNDKRVNYNFKLVEIKPSIPVCRFRIKQCQHRIKMTKIYITEDLKDIWKRKKMATELVRVKSSMKSITWNEERIEHYEQKILEQKKTLKSLKMGKTYAKNCYGDTLEEALGISAMDLLLKHALYFYSVKNVFMLCIMDVPEETKAHYFSLFNLPMLPEGVEKHIKSYLCPCYNML